MAWSSQQPSFYLLLLRCPEGFFVSSLLSVGSSPLAIVCWKIAFPVKFAALLAHRVTPREEQTHLLFDVYNDWLRVWPSTLLMTPLMYLVLLHLCISVPLSVK